MKSFSTYISAFLYSDFRKTFCFFQRFILFKLNTILKQDVMLLMATSFDQYHLISPQYHPEIWNLSSLEMFRSLQKFRLSAHLFSAFWPFFFFYKYKRRFRSKKTEHFKKLSPGWRYSETFNLDTSVYQRLFRESQATLTVSSRIYTFLSYSIIQRWNRHKNGFRQCFFWQIIPEKSCS